MYIKSVTFILVVLLSVSVDSRRKKSLFDYENEVLEKTEITLKFPLYKYKMPPLIKTRKRIGNPKVDPKPVECSSYNFTKSLNELRKKIRCIPRDTVIEVAAPGGSKVVPNTVVVKRCGGMCSGGKKCLSKNTTIAEFYVRSTQLKSGSVYCSKIEVSEDTECECRCPKKKRCMIDQKFDPTSCKCLCTNKDEERDCLNKAEMNFKWSSKNCSCICKREKICTTGTLWSKEHCKCVKE